MKVYLLIFCFVGLYTCSLLAQDKKKDSISSNFFTLKINKQLQDSVIKPLAFNLYSPIDNNIAIPNAYRKNENIIYNMPIKSLTGRGLAPMPGTENLDMIENKILKDLKK